MKLSFPTPESTLPTRAARNKEQFVALVEWLDNVLRLGPDKVYLGPLLPTDYQYHRSLVGIAVADRQDLIISLREAGWYVELSNDHGRQLDPADYTATSIWIYLKKPKG